MFKTDDKKIVAIIPARYESSRFPGKPLALIAGKPMIQRVYEAVKAVEQFCDVIVATDDDRIEKAVRDFGGKAIMTGECSCGTERVYEVAKNMEVDIIVNIQGDEPLIKKEMICDLLEGMTDDNVVMATLKKKLIKQADIDNPNVVKVITDINNDALYFSRYAIPFHRGDSNMKYYKHIGIYAYKKDFLERYVALPESELEVTEKLEQLRVLENGYKIRVIETQHDTVGVDTKEQLLEVERMIL